MARTRKPGAGVGAAMKGANPGQDDLPMKTTPSTSSAAEQETAPDLLLDSAASIRSAEESADVAALPRIPLAKLAPHPDNPPERSYVDDKVTAMLPSLHTEGLLQPITIAERYRLEADDPSAAQRLPDDAQWIVIAGHRRRVACMEAGFEEIPVLIRTSSCEPATLANLRLDENFHRVQPDPIQEAQEYARLQHSNWSTTQIAERRSTSQGQVSKRLSLLKLPEDVQTVVKAGDMAVTDALELLKLSQDEQQQVWQAWQEDPSETVRVHARRSRQSQNSTDQTGTSVSETQPQQNDPAHVAASTLEGAYDSVLRMEVTPTLRADILADAALTAGERHGQDNTWRKPVAAALGIDLPDDASLDGLDLKRATWRKVALGRALWLLHSEMTRSNEPWPPHVARHIERLTKLGVYTPEYNSAEHDS